MSHSLVEVYLHVVWGTKNRLPLISPEIEKRLHASIHNKLLMLDCQPVEVGGVEDHIHSLLKLNLNIPNPGSRVIGQLKGSSSHYATHQLGLSAFEWQSGYGAFSVSPRAVPTVRKYIQNQRQHHADGNVCPGWESRHAEPENRVFESHQEPLNHRPEPRLRGGTAEGR